MSDRELYVWIAIAGLMAATLITRSGLLVLRRDIPLPARVQRALRFAPMAALAAIIVPSVLFQQGQLFWSFENAKLMAAIAGLVVWLLTRQMLACLLGGLSIYLVMRLVVLGG